jgi:hypothetical protein
MIIKNVNYLKYVGFLGYKMNIDFYNVSHG